MYINKISKVYFSPTHSTKNVLNIMQNELPMQAEDIDLTLPKETDIKKLFNQDDLVIFGAPVHGGRIPKTYVERLKNIKGNNTPAIVIVTFGNRDYDDALLELKETVENNGFVVFSAAAFITEHSIMHSVAKNRPDDSDKSKILKFANDSVNKLINLDNLNNQEIKVKGNKPYLKYDGIPLKPHSTNTCTNCGTCAANCPVNAIPKGNPKATDKKACISCMQCVNVCPTNSRKVNPVLLNATELIFKIKCKERLEPDILL